MPAKTLTGAHHARCVSFGLGLGALLLFSSRSLADSSESARVATTEELIGGHMLRSARRSSKLIKAQAADKLTVGFSIVDGNKLLKNEIVHKDESKIVDVVKSYARLRFPNSKVDYYYHDWYTEGGEIHGVARTLDNGEQCYTAYSLEYALIVFEVCSVPKSKMPVAVHLALRKRHPDAVIQTLFRRVAANHTEYYFRMENPVDGLTYEVTFDESGEFKTEAIRVPAEIWLVTHAAKGRKK